MMTDPMANNIRAAAEFIRRQAVRETLDEEIIVGLADLMDVIARDMDENPGLPSYGWLETLAVARLVDHVD